ncbi:phosphoserine phosphatase-like [Montipora foliosa]|uniref:phosphoserine phosphatase-like n=1 Tax=Montipora foliosa TaxID=591990 RepID=UPI0035F13F8E
MTIQQAKTVWRKADAVCFDVDSTVIMDEGIDELAAFCGRGKEVSQWTIRAMGGGISFRTALRERLSIINVSRDKLDQFIEKNPLRLTPGIRELVHALHERGTPVYLISGGFKRIIQPAAEQLDIPSDNIFANRLLFDDEGCFSGFDESKPTSESGGKTRVVELLKAKFGYKNLVMIGDGATDLETFPIADTFIGFGGNVVREKVKLQAPWFVTNFQELLQELPPSHTLNGLEACINGEVNGTERHDSGTRN